MSAPQDPNGALYELLKLDFEGLYQEHIKAVEDFTGNRLRILLAVQGVPLLAIGALLSTGESKIAEHLTALRFPVGLYFLFAGAAVLGVMVLELWIGGAIHANLFARALNHTRGKYMDALRRVPGFEGWTTWLPTTAARPSLQNSGYLKGLVGAFAFVNFFYAGLAIIGLCSLYRGDGPDTVRFWFFVSLLTILGTHVHYKIFRSRVDSEQEQALEQLRKLESASEGSAV